MESIPPFDLDYFSLRTPLNGVPFSLTSIKRPVALLRFTHCFVTGLSTCERPFTAPFRCPSPLGGLVAMTIHLLSLAHLPMETNRVIPTNLLIPSPIIEQIAIGFHGAIWVSLFRGQNTKTLTHCDDIERFYQEVYVFCRLYIIVDDHSLRKFSSPPNCAPPKCLCHPISPHKNTNSLVERLSPSQDPTRITRPRTSPTQGFSNKTFVDKYLGISHIRKPLSPNQSLSLRRFSSFG